MGADKRDVEASHLDLDGRDLRSWDLRGAKFWECSMERADLRGCDVRGATFYKCDFRGIRLEGCLADHTTDWSVYWNDPVGDRKYPRDEYGNAVFRNFLLSKGVRFTPEARFLWPRFTGDMYPWGPVGETPAALDVATGEPAELSELGRA